MYILKFEEKVPGKVENAYLRVKNTRASRALRWALDPSQYWLASLAQLCFTMSAKSQKKFLGTPLDQILDPLEGRGNYLECGKSLQYEND